MNHFQVLDGNPYFMKILYDLEAEISDSSARDYVADTIAAFVGLHSSTTDIWRRCWKLFRWKGTFLRNTAHTDSTNEELETGSPWTECAQAYILDEVAGLTVNSFRVQDSSLPSYDCSLLPSVVVKEPEGFDSSSIRLEATTVSEAVYEKVAKAFSRTASELRCKLNSVQAIAVAAGLDSNIAGVSPEDNVAGVLNNRTIAWALENALEKVRRRYTARGVPIVAPFHDVAHFLGPRWIWSYLNFELRRGNDDCSSTMVVRSHTMTTSLHLPFIGGFFYVKLKTPLSTTDKK